MIAQQNYMDYQDETTTVNYQDNSFHVVNTVNAVLMQAPSDRSPEKDQLRKELQELSYTLGAERSQNEALIHDMKTQANLQFQAQERQFQERAARIEAEAREHAQNQVSEALAQSQNTMRDSLLEASERIRKGDLDVRTLQSEVQTLTRRAERSLREALEECGKQVRQELAEQRRVLVGEAEDSFRSEKDAYEALQHEYRCLEARRDPLRDNEKMQQEETARYKKRIEKAEAEVRAMREKQVDHEYAGQLQGDEFRTLQGELKDALFKIKDQDKRLLDMTTRLVHFTKQVQDLQEEKAAHEAALGENIPQIAEMEKEMANLQQQVYSWDAYYYWE